MAEHMRAAQAMMEEREAMLERTFFRAEASDDQSPSQDYLALSEHFAIRDRS